MFLLCIQTTNSTPAFASRPFQACTAEMQMAVCRRRDVCFGKIQPFEAQSSRFLMKAIGLCERSGDCSPPRASFRRPALKKKKHVPPPLAATPLECFITAAAPGGQRGTNPRAPLPLSSRVHAGSLGVIASRMGLT